MLPRCNAGATDNIGFNFQNGVGVAVDYAEAWSWLYRAAALGSALASLRVSGKHP
jgi:TPR repeat protein